MKEILRVACGCEGNKDRSPLMAALFSLGVAPAFAQTNVEVAFESFGVGDSALTDPWRTASLESQRIAREAGYDLSGHVRRHVSEVNLNFIDAFIVANHKVVNVLRAKGIANERIFVMCDPEGLSDPHGKDFPAFEACAASIRAEMPKVIRFLAQRAR